MAMPLDGIRVVDWTIWQQGPVATAILGDLGAEVIKLEERVGGDPGRGLLSASGADTTAYPNWYFEANNRNKKSLTVDLKKPEGRQIVHDLIQTADVFVQNFRKGVAGRLGLDYATLRPLNEKLIYASATGYGPEGPDSANPSFDYLGLARSGIMLAAGEPDMPPLSIAGGIADQMGAVMLSHGILAALLAREKHGVGQEVDASHLGSMMMLQGLSVSGLLMSGQPIGRQFRAQANNPLWNHYRCADDKWLALSMLQPDRYWADFTKALGRPELTNDERFANMKVRERHAAECNAILDEVFATKDRSAWIRILDAGGDFIFTVVNRLDDLPQDPQVRANDYIVDFEHPQHGTIQMMGLPVRLSRTPGSVRRAAPEFGQHTEEILLDVLGYDWDRVSELRSKQVI